MDAIAKRRLVSMFLLLSACAGSSGTSDDGLTPAGPPGKPAPPKEAAGRMTLPDGFSATLFAAEPDIRQPIAFTIDPRGRLWVAENDTYPAWLSKSKGTDRIVILEDNDGDGKHDRRKVFWDGGANVSGVALGFGGVWVCATPNLLFIPDADGDDVPDAEPEVRLDGWDVKAQHNLFNALTWAPDGWLWGCNGIMSNSRVGAPGTPDAKRAAINCGVWRYHPTRRIFEAVAHGTTNPWGLDFDDHGDAYITNCVIPHLYRVIPGARYERMYGQDFNPKTYGQIGSTADHIHWAGGHWTDSRDGKGKHGEAGGGHAHVGAMIYLGDNWPEAYRGSLYTCNLHGHRVNRDILEPKGSGTVARHAADFLLANDPWFRGLELKYGPDGGVFLTDWSDTGECHDTDADLAHRENGRIYKITYGTPKPIKVDLASLDDVSLAKLQTHPNDWYVRTARRLLQERAATGKDLLDAQDVLRTILKDDPEETHKLRALWTLHASDGINELGLMEWLASPGEHVRAWTVRLLADRGEPIPAALLRFRAMARDDPSPRVRLEIASALQRIKPSLRWAIAESLSGHAEDADDLALPLMDWYAIEPLVALDPARAVAMAAGAKIPTVRRYIARRASDADVEKAASAGLSALSEALAKSDDPACQADLLAGMLEGLAGRRGVAMPKGWHAASAKLLASPDAAVRDRVGRVALILGDADAARALRADMLDKDADPERRRSALSALAERRVGGLAVDLQALLARGELVGPTLRALAAFDDSATPKAVLARYRSLTPAERDDAVATLAARPSWAKALLDAVASGAVPPRDISTPIARQLLAFRDADIAARLERVWGKVRPASAAKAGAMSRYKTLLTPDRLKAADLARGRLAFDRACASCHRLFDAGGAVGPDLTGSDRANLDYVLENVLDPSSAVANDYKVTTIATVDGRLISGILREQSASVLVVQTANDRITLPRGDVEAVKPTADSMMPEGLFDRLPDSEVADLVAYLASRTQVPLPKGR